ncbi:hypothetical protein TNCV_3527431 [Trichonephila clavipes]|nr:hypothetical protein TNCV_3527431 [Trichonephila clavipes]
MAAVDFLHHENPPTWAGIQLATLGMDYYRAIYKSLMDYMRPTGRRLSIGALNGQMSATDPQICPDSLQLLQSLPSELRDPELTIRTFFKASSVCVHGGINCLTVEDDAP